jgi:DNA-binding transcriptional ArsR family regulator
MRINGEEGANDPHHVKQFVRRLDRDRSDAAVQRLSGGQAMPSISSFASVGALIGDNARAAILVALMDGRALTASELAGVAGVTPQTASSHLGRLVDGGLLASERQGRHHYFRLASLAVADMIESVMSASAGALPAARPLAVGPRDAKMRLVRTCYDHLAGRVAVDIADAMVRRGQLELSTDGGALTGEGEDFLGSLGIHAAHRADGRARRARVFCRPCLDWSERRWHVAGTIGAAMCNAFIERNWLRRREGTRSLEITPKGAAGLRSAFGFDPRA